MSYFKCCECCEPENEFWADSLEQIRLNTIVKIYTALLNEDHRDYGLDRMELENKAVDLADKILIAHFKRRGQRMSAMIRAYNKAYSNDTN